MRGDNRAICFPPCESAGIGLFPSPPAPDIYPIRAGFHRLINGAVNSIIIDYGKRDRRGRLMIEREGGHAELDAGIRETNGGAGYG
jgi:hypothetical protein